jgi:CDP-diacylglycerol--glycerol-3-phosphate 3-phosphatidyltransferase
MISLYKIKPAFQNLLRPLLKSLHKRNITANQITIIAVLLSILMGAGFFFYQEFRILLLLIPIGYLLRMILNALDGMMATEYNMKSKLGEILNELGDVISDLAIIIPMTLIPKMNPYIIIGFAFLSVLNEFSGVLAKSVSGIRHYEGPMGKSDRALLIGLYCIVYFFWTDIENYSNWIFSIGSVLIVISTLTRLKNALK